MRANTEDGYRNNIRTKIDSINEIGKELFDNTKPILNSTTITDFKLVPPELGFIRTVSWLYVLYREADRKTTVDFLIDKFIAYNIDVNCYSSIHIQNVLDLRTCLQHDLIIANSSNERIKDNCKRWYKKACGKNKPDSDEEWKMCLLEILCDANKFFNNLDLCLQKIKKDEDSDVIIEDWNFRMDRMHAPFEFDKIIQIVAADLGRENLNYKKFRQRYYDKWNNELRSLNHGYDFHEEARRLVEYTFLFEYEYCPINGNDIITSFKLNPGPTIGKLLSLSYDLYRNSPCSKKELIKQLEKEAKEKGIL